MISADRTLDEIRDKIERLGIIEDDVAERVKGVRNQGRELSVQK
jgi:hypothetical protein